MTQRVKEAGKGLHSIDFANSLLDESRMPRLDVFEKQGSNLDTANRRRGQQHSPPAQHK